MINKNVVHNNEPVRNICTFSVQVLLRKISYIQLSPELKGEQLGEKRFNDQYFETFRSNSSLKFKFIRFEALARGFQESTFPLCHPQSHTLNTEYIPISGALNQLYCPPSALGIRLYPSRVISGGGICRFLRN